MNDVSSSAAPPAGATSLGYRADIDGLRAVAVLLVLVFHAFAALAPGGFVGVDVFFVISGFLITAHLALALEQRRFSLAGFYQRRVRRIFPALALVLAACLAFGWWYLLTGEYQALGRYTAAGAAFIANLALWQDVGYFDPAASTKPLLHLWSLGIEEQFYFVWPVLLWAAARTRLRPQWLALALGLASFAYAVLQSGIDPTGTFYSPLTRCWELMSGAVLALAHSRQTKHKLDLSAYAAPASLLGIALVLGSALAVDDAAAFPPFMALGPILGTCLIIAAGQAAWFNRRILAQPALVWVGQISFPLYLWHWPLLAYARVLNLEPPSWKWNLALLGLSFAAAWATTAWVEKPLRFGGRGPLKAYGLAAAVLLIGLLGLDVDQRGGLAFRLPPEVRDLAEVNQYDWLPQVRGRTCHLQDPVGTVHAPLCLEAQRPLLLLWGDSHAASLYPGLKHLQQTHRIGIAQLTQSSCPPLFGIKGVPRKNCAAVNEEVFATAKDLKPAAILLHAAWNNGQFGMSDDQILAATAATVHRIQAALPSSKVIVLGPVPNWRESLGKMMIFAWKESPTHALPPRYMTFGLEPSAMTTDRRMAEGLAEQHIDYVSAIAAMCTEQGCLTRVQPGRVGLSAIDYGHLSAAGATYLMAAVADRILPSSAP